MKRHEGKDRKQVIVIVPDRADQSYEGPEGILLEQNSEILVHVPVPGVIPEMDIPFPTLVGDNEQIDSKN